MLDGFDCRRGLISNISYRGDKFINSFHGMVEIHRMYCNERAKPKVATHCLSYVGYELLVTLVKSFKDNLYKCKETSRRVVVIKVLAKQHYELDALVVCLCRCMFPRHCAHLTAKSAFHFIFGMLKIGALDLFHCDCLEALHACIRYRNTGAINVQATWLECRDRIQGGGCVLEEPPGGYSAYETETSRG
jgi:hypothetical protein